MLLNLLGNAIKFTERGSVTLKVGRHGTATGKKKLRFQVEDTGRGIPADKLEEIFLPFQQLHVPGQHVEGTGLGLAITKHLVQLMGGEIQVRATPDRGSTFWVDLELPEVDEGLPRHTKREQQIVGFTGKRKHILVVDDKRENRLLIVNLLTPLGFHVSEAAEGQEGVAKAQEGRPDLILMDLVMPGMNGVEATQQLRQSPELQDVIVIACSASAFAFNRQESLEAGCNDFLTKPVQAEDLFEKVGRYLNLQWLYDTAPRVREHGPAVAESLVVPRPEELTALFDLVKKGKVIAIRQEAACLEQLGGLSTVCGRSAADDEEFQPERTFSGSPLSARRGMKEATRNHGTILIVDDTPTNLEISSIILLSRDLHFSDGWSERPEQISDTRPDLILLDVRMPALTALTRRRLKAQEDTNHLPVIFMTALADIEDKVKGFQAGPLTMTKLIQQEEVRRG